MANGLTDEQKAEIKAIQEKVAAINARGGTPILDEAAEVAKEAAATVITTKDKYGVTRYTIASQGNYQEDMFKSAPPKSIRRNLKKPEKRGKMRHGGVHTKRPQMMHGGAYKGKSHSYAAGGKVIDMKLGK